MCIKSRKSLPVDLLPTLLLSFLRLGGSAFPHRNFWFLVYYDGAKIPAHIVPVEKSSLRPVIFLPSLQA